jgi:hypothetical protein
MNAGDDEQQQWQQEWREQQEHEKHENQSWQVDTNDNKR